MFGKDSVGSVIDEFYHLDWVAEMEETTLILREMKYSYPTAYLQELWIRLSSENDLYTMLLQSKG